MSDRAQREDKTTTDLIIEALEDALSVPSIVTDESNVMRLARQIKELQLETERVEREEAYVDARENVYIANLKSGDSMHGVGWVDKDGNWVRKEEAVKGVYGYEGKRYRVSPEEYDRIVADKPLHERIVSEYEGRVRAMKDKIEALKAEIIASKPGVAE